MLQLQCSKKSSLEPFRKNGILSPVRSILFTSFFLRLGNGDCVYGIPGELSSNFRFVFNEFELFCSQNRIIPPHLVGNAHNNSICADVEGITVDIALCGSTSSDSDRHVNPFTNGGVCDIKKNKSKSKRDHLYTFPKRMSDSFFYNKSSCRDILKSSYCHPPPPQPSPVIVLEYWEPP